MNKNDKLRNLLEDYTSTWNGGDRVPVRFNSQPYADIDGNYIAVTQYPERFFGIELDPAEELQAVINIASHETEHIRVSKLNAKAVIMAEYTGLYSKIAGKVLNIVEDHYVDHHRTSRLPGLRDVQAWLMARLHEASDPITELDPLNAYTSGLWNVSKVGTAKGITEADDDLREFLAWCRVQFRLVETAHDPEMRMNISRRIVDRLIEELPEAPETGGFEGIPGDVSEEHNGNYRADPRDEGEELPEDPAASAGSMTDDESGGSGAAESGDESPEADGESGDSAGESDGRAESERSDPTEGESPQNEENAATDKSEAESKDDGESGSGESVEGGEFDPEDIQGITETPDTAETWGGGTLPEDTVEALTKMDSLDAGDQSLGEWWNTEFDPNDRGRVAEFKREYERLILNERAESELDKLVKARNTDLPEGRISNQTIRQHMRESGLADEIREAFHRLKTGEQPHPDTYGDRLNIPAVVRHVAGDYAEREFYHRDVPGASGGRLVFVSTDASLSMTKAEAELKTMLASIAIATDEIGDKFGALGWNGHNKVHLITSPAEAFEWEHLDAVRFAFTDPMPYGIKEAKGVMDRFAAKEKLLFVLSDGEPHVTLGGTSDPGKCIEEARNLVNQYRAEEIVVIGIGTGSVDRDTMRDVFGEDGYFMSKEENLADQLVEIYEDHLDTDLSR